jgi:hypothetical protein
MLYSSLMFTKVPPLFQYLTCMSGGMVVRFSDCCACIAMLSSTSALAHCACCLPFHIACWTTLQVAQWLRSIGLPQYKGVFESNEIDGAVLLEMGTEDLDYLGISALGHRKMILAGLAEIRVDKASASKPTPAPAPAPAPAPHDVRPVSWQRWCGLGMGREKKAQDSGSRLWLGWLMGNGDDGLVFVIVVVVVVIGGGGGGG